MNMTIKTLALGTAMSLATAAGPAFAQSSANAAEPSDEADDNAEIVVTGTSIRGLVKPVGASTVAVDRDEVKATGVTSTVDLLANIPQIRNFGGAPAGQASATQSFAIPALRNLPNTQPGDGTLFLWNGNRMVGGGFSTRPDPAVIPTSAIDRVEVVLGGGSAIYGSDAVAGTINFVIRKTLDGAELRGTYGMAKEYDQFNVSGAWGKVWDTGNFLIAGDYSGHSNILGSDRSYVSNDLRSQGGSDFRLTSCEVPTSSSVRRPMPIPTGRLPRTGATRTIIRISTRMNAGGACLVRSISRLRNTSNSASTATIRSATTGSSSSRPRRRARSVRPEHAPTPSSRRRLPGRLRKPSTSPLAACSATRSSPTRIS